MENESIESLSNSSDSRVKTASILILRKAQNSPARKGWLYVRKLL